MEATDRKLRQKTSKFYLRLTILLGGALCVGIYTYFGGFLGSDEGTSVLFTSHEMIESTYGGDVYRRSLATTNDTKTCDYSGQASICIGFGANSCKKLEKDNLGFLALVILGLLYLFVGIAIVCDELFVPALEIIAEELELSNDVAGATLMAAGGSAPELATSFVGTFKRSDVGFGTIVGSAVFNVLFVIGMCVMFTPQKYSPLVLTWWPLFRDCTYYVLTLTTLAIFMYDGIILWWEALIQFFMYIGYVIMMSYSERIEEWATERFFKNDQQIAPGEDEDPELAASVVKTGGEGGAEAADEATGSDASFVRPSTFRVGILQLLTSKQSIVETAGVAFVSKIKGDVNVVFEKLDANGNGQLEPSELKMCLEELGTPQDELTDSKIDECMHSMDPERKGYVTKAAFTVWYTGNEQRLKNETRTIFDKYDFDKKNTIKRTDVKTFMTELGHAGKGNEDLIAEEASNIKSTCKDQEFLTYEDFTEWYYNSMFWDAEKAAAEQAAEAQESMMEGIFSGINDLADPDVPVLAKANFIITLPLSMLFCLIPDCRPPGKEYLAAWTLIASIVMIAFFAIIMVELAEIFGKSVGIPDVVMGLTILAAGTSVPDLLSSVIVAQQGQGDMAVSSSIGSNIFDVAVGLPVPWLVFNFVAMGNNCNCMVTVASDNLFISLIILLAMVAAIVVIIHFSQWRMTHTLGVAMFALYFIYVAISLALTPSSEYKPDTCSPFNPIA